MLAEDDFYHSVNNVKAEAVRLANRCHRQLTDLEFLQCVAGRELETLMEREMERSPETFFSRFGHEPESIREAVR